MNSGTLPMTPVEDKVTRTGGREASTRHIPPKLALAVGMPHTPPPKGWRWTALTDIARLESGHTPSRRHPEYWGGAIGFGRDQMAEMQKIINAEKSDLFDVLAHIAYALAPLTREERAARAKLAILEHFKSKQQAFLDFVLSHYVTEGVHELRPRKINTPPQTQIPQRDRRCHRRPRPARRDRLSLRRFPEVPLSAAAVTVLLSHSREFA